MNPFADSPRSLRLEDINPPAPGVLFTLRYDLRATAEGRAGGLPLQTTEWAALTAQTWEAAKVEARALVRAINPCRFDRSALHHLQGCCLVEWADPYARSFRTLAFRFAN